MIKYPEEQRIIAIERKLKQTRRKLSKLPKRLPSIDTNKTKNIGANDRIRGREHGNIRERILIRDEFTCQHCHRSYALQYLQIDHITPLHLGGAETDDNRQTLCIDCHNTKSKGEGTERNG